MMLIIFPEAKTAIFSLLKQSIPSGSVVKLLWVAQSLVRSSLQLALTVHK